MFWLSGITQLTSFCFFFFNDTATTEIYTLSLHDALPILDLGCAGHRGAVDRPANDENLAVGEHGGKQDRKSTRLNSSHLVISYAVFCLKKKKNIHDNVTQSLDNTQVLADYTIAELTHTDL